MNCSRIEYDRVLAAWESNYVYEEPEAVNA